MRVLVDIDATIADLGACTCTSTPAESHVTRLNGALEAEWRKRNPNLPYIDSKVQNNWRCSICYEELLGVEAKYEIEKIYTHSSFFDRVEPFPGAVQALNDMLLEGYNVRICSSYSVGYEAMIGGKLRWIERHLGEEWNDRVILTRDSGIACDSAT